MDTAGIDSRCKNLLKFIYNKRTFQIKQQEDILAGKIPIKRGVRQGDTISPKVVDPRIGRCIQTSGLKQRGIYIASRYLNHLRFEDDLVLISNDLEICTDGSDK